jgi:hypothetical protein
MGVTVHYRGRLKDANLIAELRDEVMDICESNGRKYDLFTDDNFFTPDPKETREERRLRRMREEQDFEDETLRSTQKLPDIGLRGILFTPHEKSESIGMLFNKKGVLHSIFSILFPEVQGKKTPWCFSKTQFAGVETHIKVVKLLTYLGKKYFKKFELEDEGGYYPNEDVSTLEQRMGSINTAIGTLEDLFENGNFEGSPDEVMSQIQDAISRSFKGVDIQVVKIDPNELENDEDKDKDDDDEKKKKRKKK